MYYLSNYNKETNEVSIVDTKDYIIVVASIEDLVDYCKRNQNDFVYGFVPDLNNGKYTVVGTINKPNIDLNISRMRTLIDDIKGVEHSLELYKFGFYLSSVKVHSNFLLRDKSTNKVVDRYVKVSYDYWKEQSSGALYTHNSLAFKLSLDISTGKVSLSIK